MPGPIRNGAAAGPAGVHGSSRRDSVSGWSRRREGIVALLSTIVSLAYGLALVGHRVRLVEALTLIAVSMGAGVAFGRVVPRRRKTQE